MTRNWVLLLVTGLCAIGVPVSTGEMSASFAQSVSDDDDDSGADDGDDDDGDVPDPDDSDSEVPGADDAGDGDAGDGGNEAGGDEAGGDDAGGADNGGNSDAGDDAGDDAGAGAGDDAGEVDADDDTPSSGAAGGSSGDDDDAGGDDTSANDANNDADDDDGSPAAGGGSAAKNGNSDDDADGDDNALGAAIAGDDDNDGSTINGDDSSDARVAVVGGGDESEDERIALDKRDGIEVDKDGFRYRTNELVALDLSQSDIARLQTEGFRVVETARLDAIGSSVSLVKSTTLRNDEDLLSQIETMQVSASVSFNYLFDTSTARIRKVAKNAVRARTACNCDIGLIDTGVATKSGLFKHVQIQQKAFNGATVVPKLHGTGVAYLFAGTGNGGSKKRTRVFVGDIFGGQRSQAGSSFALVKALNWMGQMKVPVINVSLAGPSSAAVAKTIEELTRKGHIIVAAAGNDGPAAPPVFPGAYPSVVAVTAVDLQSKVYRYANRGNYVDLSSHGVEVPLINDRGLPVVATGTSFASPTVARKLARAMTRPDVLAAKAAIAAVEREARDLGVPGRDNIFGHGLVSD